jgi:hypothetical protein
MRCYITLRLFRTSFNSGSEIGSLVAPPLGVALRACVGVSGSVAVEQRSDPGPGVSGLEGSLLTYGTLTRLGRVSRAVAAPPAGLSTLGEFLGIVL